MQHWKLVPLALAALGLAAGCATKKAEVRPTVVATSSVKPAAPSPKTQVPELAETEVNPLDEATAEKALPPLVFPVVGFEFDSEVLTDAGRTALDEFATAWRAHKNGRDLVIEGHADERGPEEYNIVLGQKRANAVRKYLAVLGLPEGALRTVSYGENRPLASERDEDAFAKNRRAAIVPK